MPLKDVHVLLSDTDLTPDGGPTTASRQTYVTGNAVRHASKVVRQAMAACLAEGVRREDEAMMISVDILLTQHRCVSCGRFWYLEEGISGICPACAQQRITAMLRQVDQARRETAGVRGVLTRVRGRKTR